MLKPNDEYGGKGVLIGWESDQATWDATLRQGADRADHRAGAGRRSPMRISRAWTSRATWRSAGGWWTATRFSFTATRSARCLTRLSTVTLLNVTAGGGSVSRRLSWIAEVRLQPAP